MWLSFIKSQGDPPFQQGQALQYVGVPKRLYYEVRCYIQVNGSILLRSNFNFNTGKYAYNALWI